MVSVTQKQNGTSVHRKLQFSARNQKNINNIKQQVKAPAQAQTRAQVQTQVKVRVQAPAVQKSVADSPVRIESIIKDVAPEPVDEKRENAIDRALVEAATSTASQRAKRGSYKVHFGFKRILLALVCVAAAGFAIVYFVDLNSPDVSLKVAAMQSGIDASYPSYVPRDFNLSDITSENGKITLNFKNASTGDAFTIVEEKTDWDSKALLSNFVRPTYGSDYVEIVEQGLTLYVSGSDACWANGGITYKLDTTSGSLTKKQIKAIAVSL